MSALTPVFRFPLIGNCRHRIANENGGPHLLRDRHRILLN
jgi:hypothetical protein